MHEDARALRVPENRSAGPTILLWLLLVTLLLRFPALLSHPFCIDESYYAAGAVELISGGAFYRDVVDHKSPGIYFIYAVIYWLAGSYNQTAVHVVLLLVAALSAYLVGLIAQTFFGGRAGRWAGTLYAMASVIGPANDFQAANTELFMNLPVLTALWLCARSWVGKNLSANEAGAMGLLMGVAILIRPQAALALLPVAVTFFRLRFGARKLLLLLAGVALPTLALLAWLWNAGVLADLQSSMAYARYYTSCLPFRMKLFNGTLKSLFFLAIDVGLIIPVVGLVAYGRRRDQAWTQGAGCWLVSWLLASVVAVTAGGRFYPHYFIQVLPPLAIMAARQLTSGETGNSIRKSWSKAALGLLALGAGMSVAIAVADRQVWPRSAWHQDRYRAVAEYVRAHTGADARIFVWGNSPEIYLYSQRRMATRYMSVNYQTGRVWGTPANDLGHPPYRDGVPALTWDNLMNDLERNRPEIIVDAAAGKLAKMDDEPIPRHARMAAFVEQHYRLETTMLGVPIFRRMP
jgi:4-amino-4-deoxy-L-arabinose transferase-like glycosyltransferase